jgi:ipoprotein LpqH
VVTNTNPPAVHSVGLGSVNGVVLGYSDAASNQAANATATQNGKTYKITGTAAGVDVANSQQAVTKSFEMDMTCP